jgi:hypothetical protein
MSLKFNVGELTIHRVIEQETTPSSRLWTFFPS